MKTTKSMYLALIAVLLSPMAANAGLINGGFEDGNLNGYTVGALTGIGSAAVAMSNTTNYSPGSWGANVTTAALEGNFMLVLGAGSADVWQEVSQTITLAAGQTLQGSAFFDWGDYWVAPNAFPDGAKVEILDSMGAAIALPWFTDGTDYCLVFCNPGTGQAGAESGWIDWSFTAAAAGSYTLVYGVMNTADGGGPNQTFGYFDAASVVPEPGTLALFGIGLIGMGLTRRRRKV
jgi:hypothetical protein